MSTGLALLILMRLETFWARGVPAPRPDTLGRDLLRDIGLGPDAERPVRGPFART